MQRSNIIQDEDRFIGSKRGVSGSFDLGFKGGRSSWGQQQDLPLKSQGQQGGQSSWGQQDLPINRQFQRGGQQWQSNNSNIIDQDIPIGQQQQWKQQQQPCSVQCDFYKGGVQGSQDWQVQQRGGLNRNSYNQDLPLVNNNYNSRGGQWQNETGVNNWNKQDLPIQGQWQNQQRGQGWNQQRDLECQLGGGNKQWGVRGQQQGYGGDLECNWKGQQMSGRW